ncbi:hypothetical protein M231_02575 [Tremella mesenterica]|uniref:FAD-binding FR-type domain-containing protein n=1 Tax=Tremella mesenterica TaxID=5217 RepID=A0A4Q1BQB3_TREME|nr:hypothetical protein M231_02575 [Tremella mesenterica]
MARPPLAPLLKVDDGFRGPKLDPYVYSDHVISSTTTLSPDHVLLTIPLSAASRESFSPNAPLPLGSTTSHTPQNPERDPAEITVQHVMIKQPDLQIERPYTPVNDPGLDGEMRLVVKRVRGGEVGRMLHSRHANELVGLRGPLTTFSIIPEAYDRIVMISSGTGVAPFLQLLASLPPQSSDPTRKAGRYHLVHLKPDSEQVDWAATSGLLPRLQEKLSYDLSTYRPEKIQKSSIQKALGSSDRSHILVLVCLPPHLMRPLCGLLGPNLEQGPITGILGELGLDNRHVWKLE